MRDPLWKTVLNWGTVVVFLTLPLVLLSFQLWNWTHPGFLQFVKGEEPHIKYLQDFLRNLTILVFGLAGLRTWETVRQNGNGKKNEPTTRDTSHG